MTTDLERNAALVTAAAELARQDERKCCARIAETWNGDNPWDAPKAIAAAIRTWQVQMTPEENDMDSSMRALLVKTVEKDSRAEIVKIDHKISAVGEIVPVSGQHRLALEKWLSGLNRARECWERMLADVTPEVVDE